MANLIREYPNTNTGKTVDVFSEAEAALHPMVRRGFLVFLTVMFAVVKFILLLACANVAGLQLARAAGRRREIAIRLALGASRLRLIRELLLESISLALLGGAAGLLLAVWLSHFIVSFRPPTDLPLQIEASLDPTVLGFTFLVAVATGIVFGLAPALQTTPQALLPSLKDGSPQGGKAAGLRQALVVGQVALSAALLVGAGLAVKSLENARSLDPGFNPDNQMVAGLELDLQGYDETSGRQFHRALREKTAGLPGVRAVGLARDLPLHLSSSQRGVLPEGYVTAEGSNDPSTKWLAWRETASTSASVSGGMKIAAVGLAVGLAGGLALGRLMQGILYGVSATDPFSFASAAVVLLGAAILASFLPARRATRVDPMLAASYFTSPIRNSFRMTIEL
jgi:hypothetical protein